MKSQRILQQLPSVFLSPGRWHAWRCPFTLSSSSIGARHASDGSSKRWIARQKQDPYTKAAILKGLKSRAAFKLLEIDLDYGIFRSGQTVVDLGYAPGSWTQVAVDRTAPRGRVIGVDIIPAMPPKGASTIQGDFTSPLVQASIKKFLSNPERGRPRKSLIFRGGEAEEKDVEEASQGYIERERQMTKSDLDESGKDSVDVVLSDMSEPWVIASGLWKESLRKPYYRMMNVSGISLRDNAQSMVIESPSILALCNSALLFCVDVLKPGGSFVCKFYTGDEGETMFKRIGKVFNKVYRDKPKASRSESKECYFVALKKKSEVDKQGLMQMLLN